MQIPGKKSGQEESKENSDKVFADGEEADSEKKTLNYRIMRVIRYSFSMG